ncbi:hypothetical protein DV706_19630 (plasmid) [Natronorubrum bangense]|uniref:Uncharacterized protein n=2 Tax=Natronorubrum bangense TaxID=61858 RepID=L9W613_9EURY|nr:hypothetical protein C494_16068 [Natronorubrum bangense JCM 10635]QCC56753.1 hypothetical protein DV706_19630 [Natronorubrum bangense]
MLLDLVQLNKIHHTFARTIVVNREAGLAFTDQYRRSSVHSPRATEMSERADDRPVGEGGVLFIEVLPRARSVAPAAQKFGLHV